MGTAIFRVSGIKKTSDLRGIGKHNLDRKSETNKDIDLNRSHENITLKTCTGSYLEMFNHVTEDLKKQHEEQMKKTRKSRQKSFLDKINDDKADVACEFLMSATPEYFEGKTHEEIKEWGKASLEFITKEIGIEEKNVLHAVVHMDEKTPHMHVVAVPLIEKYDGRRKQDVLAISRKHFIKTREDMAEVQTKYVEHMNEKGFDLERGLEKSGAKHLDVARYKMQENKKELVMTEKMLLEKKNELEKVQSTLEKNLEILPDTKEKIPYLKKEKETVKTGFMKSEEKETGNFVLSPKQMKEMSKKINAAVNVKDSYERLVTTDLVKENYELRKFAVEKVRENKSLQKENLALKEKNNDLFRENDNLRGQINDLKRDMRLVYESAKEFLKERTDGLKAFKNVFKGFVDKVRDKTTQFQEKRNLEPKRNEFELAHNREIRKERDRGMER